MQIKAATYLDSNAGAPLCPAVQELLISVLRDSSALFPNPSSIHAPGRYAKRHFSEAREAIAQSLGPKVDPEQLIFTSSGSEANQLAIRSAFEDRLNAGEKPHWITTAVEHDSSRQMIEWLKKRGGQVSYLPLDAQGCPQVEALPELLTPETALVSVIWVNHETGVVTPIHRLAELTRKHSVPLHIDAVQAWGKLKIDLTLLGAQYCSFSGHKIGALAGSGLLWVGRGQKISPCILGKQEKGRRGGTENWLGVVAMGAAARQIDPEKWTEKVAPLRDRLQAAICERIPGTRVNGGRGERIAQTLNLSFEGVETEGLVISLDLAGYAVSSGSACSSGVMEPSPVLLAMGYTGSQAKAAIRVSLPGEVSWDTLEGFIQALEKSVNRMRTTALANPGQRKEVRL